jgi:hypothetical protein
MIRHSEGTMNHITLEQLTAERGRLDELIARDKARLAEHTKEKDGLDTVEQLMKRLGAQGPVAQPHTQAEGNALRKRGRPFKVQPDVNGGDVASPAMPTQRRRRRQSGIDSPREGGLSLADRVLDLVSGAGAGGLPGSVMRGMLPGVRPNHIALAIGRHVRAHRIVEHDGVLHIA